MSDMLCRIAFVLFCFALTFAAAYVPCALSDRRRRIRARRVRVIRRATFGGK